MIMENHISLMKMENHVNLMKMKILINLIKMQIFIKYQTTIQIKYQKPQETIPRKNE